MKANRGVKIYYPELGDKKPIAEIFSRYSAHMDKYRLITPLELKGRGIKYHDTYTPENCTNPRLFGWHIYYATERAYRKLEKEYAIAQEVLLD